MPSKSPLSTPCVEITVVEVKGSAPREAGARMHWYPGGEAEGTIGGGNLELKCLAEAEALWGDPARNSAMLEYPLSAKLGQCCGGHVRVFLVKRQPERHVLICGAGHVGAAVARILADSPLRVTVADSRAEWADPSRFPERVTLLHDDAEAALREAAARAEQTFVLVMTHDHPLDQTLCQLALRHPFAWIGLIGSRTKWRRFRQRLAARGFTEKELARIVSPIGYPGLGRTPQEIAIGVAAQLLAVYHGTEFAASAPNAESAPGRRAGLILAGGAGRRMGRWKGGLLFEGQPLAPLHARAIEGAGAEVWKAVYAAIYRDEAERVIPSGRRIVNETPEAPLFASLQLGLAELIRESPDLDSVLVTPVDMIPLDEDWIAALWDRHEATGALVTRPSVRTDDPERPLRHGHPIILDQRLFAPILAADPETARLDFLIRDLPEDRKVTLEIAEPAALSNLNTPEEFREAMAEEG